MKFEELLEHIKNDPSFDLSDKIENYNNDQIKQLIAEIPKHYMKSFINQIVLTNNEEIKKYLIERYGPDRSAVFDMTKLMLGIQDKSFVKQQIIEKKVKLTIKEITDITIGLNDTDFTRKILNEYMGEFELQGFAKYNMQLIRSLNNPEIAVECIKSNDSLSDIDKVGLLLKINEEELIKKWLEIEQDEKIRRLLEHCLGKDEEYVPKSEILEISIPDELNYGIEIECGGQLEQNVRKLMEANNKYKKQDIWNVKLDRSGVEFSSPILNTSHKSILSIYRTCEFLQDMDLRSNEKDGGHIHFGADYFEHKAGEPYFETENAYYNLIEIFANCEKLFFAISNAQGQIPRKDMEADKPISRSMAN